MKINPWIFLLVGSLIGIVLLMIGIKRKSSCTATTTGRVQKVIKESTLESGSTYFLHYEYLHNERPYRAQSSIGLPGNKHRKGQSVIVHYDPNKPTRSYINHEATVQIVIGCILTIIPAFLFLFFY